MRRVPVLPRESAACRSESDGFLACGSCDWRFRPAYTDGACPVCEWRAPQVTLARLERLSVWLRTGTNGLKVGFAALAATQVTMFAVVLSAYLRR